VTVVARRRRGRELAVPWTKVGVAVPLPCVNGTPRGGEHDEAQQLGQSRKVNVSQRFPSLYKEDPRHGGAGADQALGLALHAGFSARVRRSTGRMAAADRKRGISPRRGLGYGGRVVRGSCGSNRRADTFMSPSPVRASRLRGMWWRRRAAELSRTSSAPPRGRFQGGVTVRLEGPLRPPVPIHGR